MRPSSLTSVLVAVSVLLWVLRVPPACGIFARLYNPLRSICASPLILGQEIVAMRCRALSIGRLGNMGARLSLVVRWVTLVPRMRVLTAPRYMNIVLLLSKWWATTPVQVVNGPTLVILALAQLRTVDDIGLTGILGPTLWHSLLLEWACSLLIMGTIVTETRRRLFRGLA